MHTYTDPARELVDLCDRLKSPFKERGSDHLAKNFDVEPWSVDFFRILSAIAERFDRLEEIITKSLDLDEDIRKAAAAHLEMMRHAFTDSGLHNSWEHAVGNFLSPAHVAPIRMLSGQVRLICRYPKLEGTEVDEVIALVAELRARLADIQVADEDFIRQALLGGLDQFQFRLSRIGWVGQGYVLQSLRDVISAYVIMQTGFPDRETAPNAHAILALARAALTTIYQKMKLGKDIFETTGWALKAYGAATIYVQTQHTVVGLLPHLSGG